MVAAFRQDVARQHANQNVVFDDKDNQRSGQIARSPLLSLHSGHAHPARATPRLRRLRQSRTRLIRGSDFGCRVGARQRLPMHLA